MRYFTLETAASIKRVAIGLIMAGALATSSADAAVVNSGFETGDLTGWTQSGDTGYTGAFDGGVAHSGSWYAYMGPVAMGYLSQPVSTTIGQQYKLSYWMASQGAASGAEDRFQVKINAILQPSLTVVNPTYISWTEYTATFMATTISTGIEFGATHDEDYWYIDDVSVVAVPEPTCLALIGITVGLLAVRRPRL